MASSSSSLDAAANRDSVMETAEYSAPGNTGGDVETGIELDPSKEEEEKEATPSTSSLRHNKSSLPYPRTKGGDVETALEMHPSKEDDDTDEIPPSPPQLHNNLRRARTFSALIVLVGIFSCSLFLALGISLARKKQDESFANDALALTQEISLALQDYEMGSLLLHHACRSRDMNRTQFRQVYEYLRSGGLDFQAAEFVPNVTHLERDAMEAESRAFYQQHYPNISYQGIQGFEPTDENKNVLTIQNRSIQDFYFPVHFLEPIESNEAAIDLDLYSSESRRKTIESALQTWKPALSTRLTLVQERDPSAFSVLLMHPGIALETVPDLRPRDLALLVIRIPALILRAIKHLSHSERTSLYIFDSTDEHPTFLGGATIASTAGGTTSTTFLPETNLTNVQSGNRRMLQSLVPAASRQWTIVVVALDGTYQGDNTLVAVGSIMILVACVSLALFIYSSMRRGNYETKIRSQAEAEKAALLIDGAKKAAAAERELNDYIAHEIRNPVSAAMSAVSFVCASVDEEPPLVDAESKKSVREDMHIIQNSLKYVNDLLRSMLDFHRAASNQMKFSFAPTDVFKDVLEPVSSMLYCRGSNFDVTVDCPKDLMVSTDRLRLTQVILNLGRNSCKFVSNGFIRLGASVVNDCVQLRVEDSGPSIPLEKRKQLFNKFQDSLDSLSQGTGIGLCLCKNLIDLMGGEITLDESFDSGIAGCPGTRFVINLKVPPLKLDLDAYESKDPVPEEKTEDDAPALPEHLSVLFVDDDPVLRKLFARALKRVQPGWRIQEAASGESALDLVDSDEFHVIFMDQYMASVEKQLLGTETTVELRRKGIQSTICGLSANDMKIQFMNAGADYFLLKPIPTEKGALKRELGRIIVCGERQWTPPLTSLSDSAPACEAVATTEVRGSREWKGDACSRDAPV